MGDPLDYKNPKKLFYNIRNHRWMMIKNTNAFVHFNFTRSSQKVYCALNRLKAILLINIFFALSTLIFKFQHFKEIIKRTNLIV